MNTKPLIPTITFLFLLFGTGVIYGQEPEVKKEYWDNGELKSELRIKNGLKDGLAIRWFENGNKMSESHYKNGELEGLATGWYENGSKILEEHFKDGNEL